MREQKAVADATVRRGYRKGWTNEQFLARQCAKLQEELAEIVQCVNVSGNRDIALHTAITYAGSVARKYFDDHDYWIWQSTITRKRKERIAQLKKEIADCQVVLFNMADAIGEITGEPFDLVGAAVEKATADIERGIRNGAKE